MNLSYLTGDVRKFFSVIERSSKDFRKNSRLEAEILAQLAKATEFWRQTSKVDFAKIETKVEPPKFRNYRTVFKHFDNLQGSLDRAEIEYLFNQLKEK